MPKKKKNERNYKTHLVSGCQSISIEECHSILFYHPKKLFYQLYHTILQYIIHPKTLLFYFFIKILFFNLSLLFLSNHHFFLANDMIPTVTFWNKIYIFFRILLQYNSKVRIVLQHYCKKFCNSRVYNFLMQMFLSHEMPKSPQIWYQHSSMLMLSRLIKGFEC